MNKKITQENWLVTAGSELDCRRYRLCSRRLLGHEATDRSVHGHDLPLHWAPIAEPDVGCRKVNEWYKRSRLGNCSNHLRGQTDTFTVDVEPILEVYQTTREDEGAPAPAKTRSRGR